MVLEQYNGWMADTPISFKKVKDKKHIYEVYDFGVFPENNKGFPLDWFAEFWVGKTLELSDQFWAKWDLIVTGKRKAAKMTFFVETREAIREVFLAKQVNGIRFMIKTIFDI